MLSTKSLPFVCLIFVFSCFLSFFINAFFSEALVNFNGRQSLYSLLGIIVLIFLLLSITGILYLLAEPKERWVATAISSFGFLVGLNIDGFVLNDFLASILLTIIFAAAIFYFDSQLTINYRNMIKPHFSLAIQHSAGGFIFFFSLIIALNFYMFNQSEASRDILLRKALGIVIDPVAKFTHEDTVKILEAISPELRSIIENRPQSESTYGLQQNNSTTVLNEQAAEAVKNAFADQMQQYTAIIMNVITLFIFLSLFSVFKLAKLFIGPLVSILIWLLRKTNYIIEENEMVEIVRYRF